MRGDARCIPGAAARPPVTIDEPAHHGAISRETEADILKVLNGPACDPDLVEQALAHLNGAAKPVGAAAAAAAAMGPGTYICAPSI
jgi:hypothetical protein